MVTIITGASHTGKTVLAKQLVRKTGGFCLSLDHLKMGLIRSGYTSLTVYDDEELTGLLWPIAREMVKTAIENRQDLIIEGCYVPFDWKKDFDGIYLSEIRYICLVMTEKYIRNSFGSIIAHRSDEEKRITDPDLSENELILQNRYFLEGSQLAGNEILLIDEDWSSATGKWLSAETF